MVEEYRTWPGPRSVWVAVVPWMWSHSVGAAHIHRPVWVAVVPWMWSYSVGAAHIHRPVPSTPIRSVGADRPVRVAVVTLSLRN
jgi:hypothetical protein